VKPPQRRFQITSREQISIDVNERPFWLPINETPGRLRESSGRLNWPAGVYS
jgi:hypothetical protein